MALALPDPQAAREFGIVAAHFLDDRSASSPLLTGRKRSAFI
jgi:hypothetical protein